VIELGGGRSHAAFTSQVDGENGSPGMRRVHQPPWNRHEEERCGVAVR